MKRNGNNRYLIIALVLMIAMFGTAYALFAEQLNITGSAHTDGSFDLEFNSATVGTPTSHAGTPTATISTNKNTLTLAADSLTQPGAVVTYDVVIKNVGSIDATLKTVNITGNTDPDLTVTVSPAFTTGTTVTAGATYEFKIIVSWPLASQVGEKTVNYTVSLDYEQAV